jgi:hypothetical protein
MGWDGMGRDGHTEGLGVDGEGAPKDHLGRLARPRARREGEGAAAFRGGDASGGVEARELENGRACGMRMGGDETRRGEKRSEMRGDGRGGGEKRSEMRGDERGGGEKRSKMKRWDERRGDGMQ